MRRKAHIKVPSKVPKNEGSCFIWLAVPLGPVKDDLIVYNELEEGETPGGMVEEETLWTMWVGELGPQL